MSVFSATKGRGRGQWWPSQQEDDALSASLYCRDCGRVSSLSAHVIASDGTVSPSCVCTHKKVDEVECPCGFHEFVTLVGWSQELAHNNGAPKFFERVAELRKDPAFQQRAAEEAAEADRVIDAAIQAKAQDV